MNLPGIPTHGGEYTVYDIFGTMFEVSAKYVPPIDILGFGSYGVVNSFVNSVTGQKVAIKKIKNAFDGQNRAQNILREIMLLKHMDHENVISLLDIIRPPCRYEFIDVYIVCEYVAMDLLLYRQSQTIIYPDAIQGIMYQLLCGLKYIHSANILHRDLKPANLLVNEDYQLKICDFGMARTLPRDGYMETNVGTRSYRAPEILLQCNDYTAAIDVWSAGCVFMELMTGEELFPVHGTRSTSEHLKLITELIGSPDDSDLGFLEYGPRNGWLEQLPRYQKQPLIRKYPTLNPDGLDLVEKMLMFDPHKRITAEHALRHNYFVTWQDIDDEPAVPAPDFEQLTVENIKDLVMEEALAFNPLPNIRQ